MWMLKLVGGQEDLQIYVVPEKREITIGRSNSDVCLVSDSSISRKHCVLRIAEKEGCPLPVQTRTGLWVEEPGSKYGTFLLTADKSFAKITPNQPCLLTHGSVVRFGVLQHAFRAEYKPINVCTSMVPTALKAELRAKLGSLGGEMTTQWDKRCSYLIACSISLTVKVLLAMVHGVPIVRPDFIDQLLVAVKENQPLPDPRPSRPNLAETAVRVEDVNLEPGYKRETLFQGLKFYGTVPEQLDSYKVVVEAAGGTIALLGMDWSALLEKGAVMLDLTGAGNSQASQTPEASQTTMEIRAFLQENGRRMVPDREIPLAIAYSSVSRMCNAFSGSFSGPTVNSMLPPPVSQSTLLEDFTEDRQGVENTLGFGVVDSTFSLRCDLKPRISHVQAPTPTPPEAARYARVEPSQSSAGSFTRKRAIGSLDLFDDENPSKRLLTEAAHSATSSVGYGIPALDRINEDKNKESNSGSWNIGGRLGSSSQARIQKPAPSPVAVSDFHPFGKRKASVEERTDESAKRSKGSGATGQSARSSLDYKKDTVSDGSDNRKASASSAAPTSGYGFQDLPTRSAASNDALAKSRLNSDCSEDPVAASSTLLPPAFQFPRPRPPSTVSKPPGPSSVESSRISHVDYSGLDGWIDMTHKKDGERTTGDALSSTIIMLSLVTLAQARNEAISKQGQTDGPRNVKVFKKQTVPEMTGSVDLQRVTGAGPDFTDEWCRITR